jgi:hypothetical protein
MSTSTTTTSGGIGFFGLLTILFVALKLTGVIHWSWWLVLLPMLPALIFLIGAILFGSWLLAMVLMSATPKRRPT